MSKHNFTQSEYFKWDFLKYEIQKFTFSYSTTTANLKREKVSFLEQRLKDLEPNVNNEETKSQFQGNVNGIYEKISTHIETRSRCKWYEFGKKSNKYLLNLEKAELVKMFCVRFAPKPKK